MARALKRAADPGRAGARLRVRCPAKINLGLWILGRRPDGYHEIDTIVQAITLDDELLLRPGAAGLDFAARGLRIPGDGPNLVERAWSLLLEEGLLPRGAGLSVTLTKRIPVGAGLGGGSSDATGMLAGANRWFDIGLSDDDLERLAARLGSDAPFFVRGGTARATGRGERVGHLCPGSPLWVVLASPPIAISTTWAYGMLRNRLTGGGSEASILAAALADGALTDVARAMRNVFEDVLLPQVPEIAALKRALASNGAVAAQLTGSGSTVFGLAASREAALDIMAGVSSCRAEIRLVRTLERGVIVAGRS